MSDLQIIKLVDALPIRQAQIMSNNPYTFKLSGADYSKVSEVRINGERVTKVTVSASHILVEVPDVLVENGITSIEAYSDYYSGTNATRTGYTVGRSPESVDGLLKLVQQIIRLLLTTPGTDIFNQGDGGGLRQYIGISPEKGADSSPMYARVLESIKRVQSSIRSAQMLRRLPKDEKLRSLEPINVNFDRKTGTLLLRISVLSEAGRSVLADLRVS